MSLSKCAKQEIKRNIFIVLDGFLKSALSLNEHDFDFDLRRIRLTLDGFVFCFPKGILSIPDKDFFASIDKLCQSLYDGTREELINRVSGIRDYVNEW